MSTAARDAPWPERRFSQAIAEGDGMSVIPAIAGDVGSLAAAAEAVGAEAVLVDSISDVETARATTGLPIVVRLSSVTTEGLGAARAGGADAVSIAASALVADGTDAYVQALELGLDCAIEVADEEELEMVLDALEPEILVARLAQSALEGDGGDLTLLAGVPAGKLVVVETGSVDRDAAITLETAGVDALVVEAPAALAELEAMLRDLIRAEHPLA